MRVAKKFKMTSIGREPNDSTLVKENVIHQHHSLTVFVLVWPSGIDCARKRNGAYTPGIFEWSTGSPSSVLCLLAA